MSTPSSQTHKPPASASTPTTFPHPNFNSPASRSVASPAAHRGTGSQQAGKSPFNPSITVGGPTSTPTTTTTATVKAETPAIAKPETPQSGSKHVPSSANAAKEKLGLGLGATGSPAAGGALDFASPTAALGLSLSSQGINLDGTGGSGAGGIGMGLSMSGIGSISGLGLSSMGLSTRIDDEERRRRLESVIATLGKRKGRVGEEGVERACRRNGWATMWEDRRGGGRRLTGAGTNVLVDVDFVGKDKVEKVTTTVHEAGEGVKGTMEQAGKVLLADLQEGVSSLDKKLDRFAGNLDKLARLDKLSRTQEGLNCYDAVAGVYTSLQRLYEHQFKVAAELFKEKPDAVRRAEREVMCKKSGRPRMHARRAIGLGLDYWQFKKDELSSKDSKLAIRRNSSAMEVDSSRGASDDKGSTEGDKGLFSLTIDAEPSPAALYPSIRTSNHWLSDVVEKQPEENTTDLDQLLSTAPDQPVIDWQEPPPTYLTSTITGAAGENADAMAIDAATGNVGKLPDVRFSAKFTPPVVLPLALATQILNQLQTGIPQEPPRLTSFESLVLQKSDTSTYDANAVIEGTRIITAEKTIIVPEAASNEDVETEHHYSLRSSKMIDYGRALEELPFSHPRQIIQLLPTLRQYAFLSSVLQSTFASSSSSITQPGHDSRTANGISKPPMDDLDFISGLDNVDGTEDEQDAAALSDLVSQDTTISSKTIEDDGSIALPIKVTLTLTPSPSLNVGFPLGELHAASITVEISPNAEVSVAAQNLLPEPLEAASDEEIQDAESRRMRQLQGIGRALEICGDIGIWVEWMRRRFANG